MFAAVAGLQDPGRSAAASANSEALRHSSKKMHVNERHMSDKDVAQTVAARAGLGTLSLPSPCRKNITA